MTVRLEHANLRVANIDDSIKFLTTAFPEFRIRGRGDNNGRPWLHIGTNGAYLALNENLSSENGAGQGPLNHLGFVVDDVDAIAARLAAAGYREGFVAPPHPHRRRRYFHDAQGIEWEFIEYLSDDMDERHDYSL